MSTRNPHGLVELLSLGLLCAPGWGMAPLQPQAPRPPNNSRVVHEFDFDERAQGNLEVLPRYWSPLYGNGFPRYTRGGFDDVIGHTAPPSFRIETNGRNVAYHYGGSEIAVHPSCSYRVAGFVRLAGMKHSRACIGVHFLDANRNPMAETVRRTPYLGPAIEDQWQPFEVYIAAAPTEAKFLGLSLWILQDETWNTQRQEPALSLVDVPATAWFDDITVFRLPSMDITTRQEGEILEYGNAALWVSLSDAAEFPITATIRVVSAAGQEVFSRRVDDAGGLPEPVRHDLSALQPGAYDARVEIVEHETIVASQTLRFLIQPRLDARMHAQVRSFGIVLDARSITDLGQQEAAVLNRHTARSVKIPIDDAPDRTLEKHCQDLEKNGFLLTAVVTGTDAAAENYDWVRTFAASAAQTAGIFRWWQVGVDSQPLTADAGIAAASTLRKALQDFVSAPRLALTTDVLGDSAGQRLPVEQVTLPVTGARDRWKLAERIEALRGRGHDEVAAFVPPLPGYFDREYRLADWTQRLIEARHAGADRVYIPQPWRIEATRNGSRVAPEEEYLLYRTVAAMIGDSKPGPALSCGDSVRCVAFTHGNRSVVAIWDPSPPPGGRQVALQLGAAGRYVDLWGQAYPLPRDASSRQLIPISAMPVFVDQVDSWVTEFAASMTLDPEVAESGVESSVHELVIHCEGSSGRLGSGIFMSPPGVAVVPRRFDFLSCAGQPVRIPIEIRYSHNEPAGRKEIITRVKLDDPEYTFEIPLSVELRTTNIDVYGRATLEGGDLLLRHSVHNASAEPASFRSIADVPGRQRQYRPITNLAPGATQTIEFRFHDATELVGRRVNLALRELNDGARKHNLELVVP